MLKSLTIRNYALIESVEIEFESGLNILTGETGAGKSIIIDALSLILGDRASADVVRKGSDKAIVEGINMVSKHTKPNSKSPQGGIIKKEAPVHISNLMIVDPKSGESTRIGRRLTDDNKLVRYAKKSGEEIK